MIRLLFVAICFVSAACSRTDQAQVQDLTEEEVLAQDSILRDTSTVLELEQPARGELSLFGVGSHDFKGRFRATAGLCGQLRFLELTVRNDSLDTIMLFRLPESAEAAVGPYVVTSPMDDYFVIGSVRVGFQLIRGRAASVFRGIGGSVELTDWGPQVSGTFTATMQEAATDQITKIMGQFIDVRVDAGDDDECAVTAAAFVNADSAGVDLGTVRDSLVPASGS